MPVPTAPTTAPPSAAVTDASAVPALVPVPGVAATAAPVQIWRLTAAPGGPVVAVFTGAPTDQAVAVHAAAPAAERRTYLVAAAAVAGSGFSVNPLLHQARADRFTAQTGAILAPVTALLRQSQLVYRPVTLGSWDYPAENSR